MIQKISRMEKIGKFNQLTQNKQFQYGNNQHCNIILGYNGSGKSTISNAMSVFGNDNFISEEEKENLFNDISNSYNSVIELLLQESSRIKFPASRKHSKNIYVFNTNFTLNHVFDGTRANMRKFKNVSAEIKNKKITDYNTKIAELQKEYDGLLVENNKLEGENKKITQKYSKEFSNVLTDMNKKLSNKKIDKIQISSEKNSEIRNRIIELKNDYDLSKKQDDIKSDIDELSTIKFNEITIDYSEINSLLSTNIQKDAKKLIQNKINTIQELFDDNEKKSEVEHWIKFGNEILVKSVGERSPTCPLCESDISGSINNITDEYQKYFDESYDNLINGLSARIESAENNYSITQRYSEYAKMMEKIYDKYNINFEDMKNFDYNFDNISQSIKGIISKLKAKRDNVQEIMQLQKLNEESYSLFNKKIVEYESIKIKLEEYLKSKSLNTSDIEKELRKAFESLIAQELDEILDGGALDKYKSNTKRIDIINKSDIEGIPYYRKLLMEELSKIKAESRSISKYLEKMGIDNFIVDINSNVEDENVIIKYKATDIKINRIRNCLSDGEKTALAFAYFLSKYENEVIPGGAADNCVIVDDPISSLDDNRLYSTANIIKNVFQDVKQLIVLSHNLLFLKYFNSFYNGKANCLFLDKNEINGLPKELKNFETPYYYMLKEIIEFANDHSTLTYENSKKYLPNYIRKVLETFLSFKFAKVASERTSYRSPGLNEYSKYINHTDYPETLKQELINMIDEIVKVTDRFSHGNPQNIQENYYISNVDLKKFAKNTIMIIENMDNLHKTSYIAN